MRTNRIHVITRPINMPFIRKLIAEFDANVEFAKPVTRPLRYISASDVLPVLVQALTEPGGNSNKAAPAEPVGRNLEQRHNARPIPPSRIHTMPVKPAPRAKAISTSPRNFPHSRLILHPKRSRSATPKSSPTNAQTPSSFWAIARSW